MKTWRLENPPLSASVLKHSDVICEISLTQNKSTMKLRTAIIVLLVKQ